MTALKLDLSLPSFRIPGPGDQIKGPRWFPKKPTSAEWPSMPPSVEKQRNFTSCVAEYDPTLSALVHIVISPWPNTESRSTADGVPYTILHGDQSRDRASTFANRTCNGTPDVLSYLNSDVRGCATHFDWPVLYPIEFRDQRCSTSPPITPSPHAVFATY